MALEFGLEYSSIHQVEKVWGVGAGNSKSKGVRAEGGELFAGNDFVVVGIEVW